MEAAYRRFAAEPAAAGGSSHAGGHRAPEFDPGYEMCGGMATAGRAMRPRPWVALEDAGYDEYTRGLAQWLVDAHCRRGVGTEVLVRRRKVASSWALRR